MSAKKAPAPVAFDQYAAPEYQAWQWLVRRQLPVCKKWLESFEKFLADLGPKPPGQFLTRINPDKPYQPGNCHWTPPVKLNNQPRLITLRDETKTISQWADHLGITREALKNRLKRMPVDEALCHVKYSRRKKEPARGGKSAGRMPAGQKPAAEKPAGKRTDKLK